MRWFPHGSKAALLKPVTVESPGQLTVGEYAERRWLPSKQPPAVRRWLAVTYAKHLRHIVPAFGDVLLTDVTPRALVDFRTRLTHSKSAGGRGLKLKTARDIIDGTFRALYRDARDTDGLVTGDPFAKLKWPRKVPVLPDPFTEAERDELLHYFRRKDRHYFPLVYSQFWTGMRPSEALGARRGIIDFRTGKLHIRVSRSYGEDNPTKTVHSERAITLRPDVLAVLREMPAPLHATDQTFLFTTQHGTPINVERFVEQHWHRALRATSIRPRKFYATRHTFISVALTHGCNIKWLADYCGTSVEMIERHYAKYLGGDGDLQLAKLGGGEAESPIPRRHGDAVPLPGAKPGSARAVSGIGTRRNRVTKR